MGRMMGAYFVHQGVSERFHTSDVFDIGESLGPGFYVIKLVRLRSFFRSYRILITELDSIDESRLGHERLDEPSNSDTTTGDI